MIEVDVAPAQVAHWDEVMAKVPDAVAADSHGITHSIRGRLERCGGRARVESAPGTGTEWELEVPL